jgi:hypothetical protein
VYDVIDIDADEIIWCFRKQHPDTATARDLREYLFQAARGARIVYRAYHPRVRANRSLAITVIRVPAKPKRHKLRQMVKIVALVLRKFAVFDAAKLVAGATVLKSCHIVLILLH